MRNFTPTKKAATKQAKLNPMKGSANLNNRAKNRCMMEQRSQHQSQSHALLVVLNST
jgi:hypothetical protein